MAATLPAKVVGLSRWRANCRPRISVKELLDRFIAVSTRTCTGSDSTRASSVPLPLAAAGSAATVMPCAVSWVAKILAASRPGVRLRPPAASLPSSTHSAESWVTWSR